MADLARELARLPGPLIHIHTVVGYYNTVFPVKILGMDMLLGWPEPRGWGAGPGGRGGARPRAPALAPVPPAAVHQDSVDSVLYLDM